MLLALVGFVLLYALEEHLGPSCSLLHSESQINTWQTAHPLIHAVQGWGWLIPEKRLPTARWCGGNPPNALEKGS